MHHFVFEFITGGGLTGQTLPVSLLKEGELMLQTLVNELFQAGHTDITITRDARLKPILNNIKQVFVNEPIDHVLPSIISKGDIVWCIAPEAEDQLASLTELFEAAGCEVLGSRADAIRKTTSKLGTANILTGANINTVETVSLNDILPKSRDGWIVKPDDGAGAERCFFFNSKKKLEQFKKYNACEKLLLQPFIKGKHLSMSLLIFGDDVRLLACNRQYINIVDDAIKLSGIGVNECLEYQDEFLSLAGEIISLFPGLAGYVGVDLIATKNGLTVLEINPRFTTAFTGLSSSLGINVSNVILEAFLNKELPEIDLTMSKMVKVDL